MFHNTTYLVEENTFLSGAESAWFPGQWLRENCLLAVVRSSLLFDDIIPQLGHNWSQNYPEREPAPRQQGARVYNPRVL